MLRKHTASTRNLYSAVCFPNKKEVENEIDKM